MKGHSRLELWVGTIYFYHLGFLPHRLRDTQGCGRNKKKRDEKKGAFTSIICFPSVWMDLHLGKSHMIMSPANQVLLFVRNSMTIRVNLWSWHAQNVPDDCCIVPSCVHHFLYRGAVPLRFSVYLSTQCRSICMHMCIVNNILHMNTHLRCL